MKRTKDELLQSCIEQFEHIDSVNNNPTLNTTESLIMEIKEAINYTHSCESDSELLPSFLYKDEGGLYFKHLEDTDITEQWNEYLKTR